MELGGRDFGSDPFQGDGSALGVRLGLRFQRPQLDDALLQRVVGQIGDTALDGVIEPFQPRPGLGRLLAQFGRVGGPALGALLLAIEHARQHFLQPFRVEQPGFEVLGDQIVEPLHRNRPALAAGLALPGGRRTGVVAIAPGFAGADGHGPAAISAEANAGQHGGATDDLRRGDFRIARFQMRLHRIEHLLVDQRRNRHDNNLIDRVQRLGLGAFVELMAADIGRAGQHAMDRTHAPAAAGTGIELAFVQVLGDRFDAHAARSTITRQRELERQPHRVGVERVDLQLLLDLGPALFGIDHPVADRRQRAVPKALARILLQGPKRVLGRLLGLVFVEQRHDLAHHDLHRIVAEFLRHRDQSDAILGELPDVEFQLEMVAEEPAEGVDHHQIKHGRPGRARLDHLLERRAAVIGRRRPRFHIGFDQLVAARDAIGFALPALIGDRHGVLGLPGRRDTQVKRGAQRHGAHAALNAF